MQMTKWIDGGRLIISLLRETKIKNALTILSIIDVISLFASSNSRNDL